MLVGPQIAGAATEITSADKSKVRDVLVEAHAGIPHEANAPANPSTVPGALHCEPARGFTLET